MRGLFGSIISKLAAATPRIGSAGLEQHFVALNQVSGGLARQVETFILSGEGRSVLSTLATPGASAAWQSRTGRYGSGKSPVVRMLADAGADLDILIRFGEVLAVLDPSPHVGHWGAFGTKATPDWLRHAVSQDGGPNRTTPLCAITRLADLAHAGGADTLAVLDILFHPGPGVPYGTVNSVEMFTGTADWLAAHSAAVGEHQAKLDAAGRVELAHAIGRFGLSGIYVDLLVDFGTSTAKTVRAAATRALTAAPQDALSAALAERYAGSNPGTRTELVSLAMGALAGDAGPLLERWQAGETEKRPREALSRALANIALDDGPKPAVGPWERGYVALDGSTIALAPAAVLPEPTRIAEAAFDALRGAVAAYNAAIMALRKAHEREKNHWSRHHQIVSESDLSAFRRQIEASGQIKHNYQRSGVSALLWSNHFLKWDRSGVAAFFAHPSVTLRHLIASLRHDAGWSFFRVIGDSFEHAAAQELRRRLLAGDDVIVTAALWTELGGKSPVLEYLQEAWMASLDNLENGVVWPLAANAFDEIDEALGLRPQVSQPQLHAGNALDLLQSFPKVPHRYLLALMTIATGSQKTLRQRARTLLVGAPNIDSAIEDLLGEGKQETRAGAAEWLAARGTTGAVPGLRKALGKEKSEIARAAIITALETLGDDVSDCFDPKGLRAEAEAGLAKTSAKGLEWFPFDLLPRVTWQDGGPVDPIVVRWWIVLANKLKQPGSNALLDLWMARLATDDARRLSLFVLRSWIEQDTRRPGEDEGNAFAAAHVDANLRSNQQAVRRYPQHADYYVTDRDKLFAMIKRTKMNEYFGSATDNKGILALATQAEGADAAAAVRGFLKEHGSRVSQAKALLDVLAANPAGAAIQVVLATANRFKARTVQEHAAALIERIAERRGWTPDELADRTIPSAGLDERGECDLDCGEGRTYRLVLDAQDALILLNPAGKPTSSLPAARNEDETALIAATKKQLATARKELKQATAAQIERLYEAMCLERRWSVEDWGQYLLRHPIMGRLLRRLVWIGLDGEGDRVALFRPLDDGSLSDVDDGEISLDTIAQVQLAHGSLVSESEAAAWRTHLGDYEVRSPFAQFGESLPTLAESERKRTSIDDRLGWMIETFKLRGAANKAGFVRGAAEDGGVFMTYERRYESAKLVALIEFTGSPLPEENIPAALQEMRFATLGRGNGWHGSGVTLETVPPVLLAESRKALHQIAAAGTGFDPAWEKKSGW